MGAASAIASAMNTELENLKDGIESTFWDTFCKHVTDEWGPSGLRYQQAVREAAQSADAVIGLQKVLHTQEAILSLMRWPADRISTLKAQKDRAEASPSRRGYGL